MSFLFSSGFTSKHTKTGRSMALGAALGSSLARGSGTNDNCYYTPEGNYTNNWCGCPIDYEGDYLCNGRWCRPTTTATTTTSTTATTTTSTTATTTTSTGTETKRYDTRPQNSWNFGPNTGYAQSSNAYGGR